LDTATVVLQPIPGLGNVNRRINERAKVPGRKTGSADNVYCRPLLVRSDANAHRYFGGTYDLRSAGNVIELTAGSSFANKGYGDRPVWATRGAVGTFSEKSRRRLAKACAAIPWGAFPGLFVTLTYPGQFVKDGVVCSTHLQNFRRAWDRRYGAPVGVWKREYQRRGAVHFHLALVAPGVDLSEVREWASATWFRIVGSGDESHLKAGTQVEVLRHPPAHYFSCHGQHGRDEKGYQNEVPEDFVNPGRFWGLWNIAPDWVDTPLTPAEWVECKRIVQAWSRSRGLYRRDYGRGRIQGLWINARGPGFLLADQVLCAARYALDS
jgi:hypothetical protein